VAAEYDRLSAAEPGRWVRIDAARAPEAVSADVLLSVQPLLKEVTRSSS
jgi:thymidylate kinase